MKKLKFVFVLFFLCTIFLINPTQTEAVFYTIQVGTEAPAFIGDFIFAGSQNVASAPGQVYDVLQLKDNGLESGNNLISPPINGTIAMGDLWSTLDSGGILYTTQLVFGFGINESGSTGSNYVDIQDLFMSFDLPGGGISQFDMDSDENNTVRVYNFKQGQTTAEALVQVNLGFDFMSAYNASSTESFYISSTINDVDDGFEIYFLSSAFTGNPPVPNPSVPIPGTLLLVGSSLFGLIGIKKKV